MNAYDDFYKSWRGKTPVNAVRLAIADHEAQDGRGIGDFTHALRIAVRRLELFDDMLATLGDAGLALARTGGPQFGALGADRGLLERIATVIEKAPV